MWGGAFVVGTDGREKEVECGVGDVATVWDGEVVGMSGGLAKVRQERIVAGSKAAIAAVKKAGRIGKARSLHLQSTVDMIAEMREGAIPVIHVLIPSPAITLRVGKNK